MYYFGWSGGFWKDDCCAEIRGVCLSANRQSALSMRVVQHTLKCSYLHVSIREKLFQWCCVTHSVFFLSKRGLMQDYRSNLITAEKEWSKMRFENLNNNRLIINNLIINETRGQSLNQDPSQRYIEMNCKTRSTYSKLQCHKRDKLSWD